MLPNVITEEVIRSHIVPGNLMFSRPIAGSSNAAEPSHTAQWGHPRSPMKVSVTMYTESDGSGRYLALGANPTPVCSLGGTR